MSEGHPPPPPPPPESRPVIGVDEPAGKEGLRWWHIAVIAVLALGVGAWIVDALSTSDEEAAAKTATAFIRSYADQDGAAFCESLTPKAQQEIIDSSRAFGGGDDCESAADLQLEQLLALEGVSEKLGEIGEIDESDVEDAVEIDGDEARIDLDQPLVSSALVLEQQGDGEWLIGSESFEAAVSGGDGSGGEDAIAAADRLCLTAFGEISTAIGGPAGASAPGSAELDDTVRQLLTTNRQLLSDLEELEARSSEPALTALVVAQREVVATTEVLDLSGRGSGVRDWAAANRGFTRVASEEGFAELGCAAPTTEPGAG